MHLVVLGKKEWHSVSIWFVLISPQSRALLLKVWAANQQHWYHLGVRQKCKFSIALDTEAWRDWRICQGYTVRYGWNPIPLTPKLTVSARTGSWGLCTTKVTKGILAQRGNFPLKLNIISKCLLLSEGHSRILDQY